MVACLTQGSASIRSRAASTSKVTSEGRLPMPGRLRMSTSEVSLWPVISTSLIFEPRPGGDRGDHRGGVAADDRAGDGGRQEKDAHALEAGMTRGCASERRRSARTGFRRKRGSTMPPKPPPAGASSASVSSGFSP